MKCNFDQLDESFDRISTNLVWFSGTTSIASACDVYHKEGGIVRNVLFVQIAARGSPAVLTLTGTASRNGNTSIRRARKILEYMSLRSVSRVRSEYTSRHTIYLTNTETWLF